MKVSRGNRMRGFSLLELLLVLAVVMVVTAMALPNMLTSMEQYRLRSKASDLSAMLQRARSVAVKRSQPAGLSLTGSTFSIIGSTTEDAARLQLALPGNISVPTAGMPGSLTATSMGFASVVTITAAGSSTPAYFNARGLPCPYDNATKTCTSTNSGQAYVYYLRDSAFPGRNGWAAVSVSPSGRTKVWRWDGSSWK